MNRPKVETDPYTKLELEESKAEMDSYRSGGFGCCFNEIMKWIKFHSNRDETVKWGSAEFLYRKRVLGKIEQCMKTTHLKPIMRKVNLLSRLGWTTVPIYDYQNTVLSMVRDETIMGEEF